MQGSISQRYRKYGQVSDYPKQAIISIMEKNKGFDVYFGDIMKPSRHIVLTSRRKSGEPEPFCTTREKTEIPKWKKDVTGADRCIVNVGKKHIQAITYEECIYTNNFKNKTQDCYVKSPKTTCMQVFSIVKLLTANLQTNKLEFHSFQIPSTCVCAYI